MRRAVKTQRGSHRETKWIYAVGTYLLTGPQWPGHVINVTRWAIMRPRNLTPVRDEGTFRASQVGGDENIAAATTAFVESSFRIGHIEASAKHNYRPFRVRRGEKEYLRLHPAPPLHGFSSSRAIPRIVFQVSLQPSKSTTLALRLVDVILPRMIFADQSSNHTMEYIILRYQENILQYQLAISIKKRIMIVLDFLFIWYEKKN